MDYYDEISQGYEKLHKEEQLNKLSIVKKYIKPKSNEKLLDVGCGTGISSDFNCIVYGIDSSEELISILKRNERNVISCIGYAEDLPYDDNFFDYVISLTAIQNFNDIEKGLMEMKRVGKSCFIVTFLKNSPKKELILNSIKNIFGEYKLVEEAKDLIVFIQNI